MKFRITLNKVYEVDTSKEWDDEQPIIDQLAKEGADVKNATPDEIADAIRDCIAEDGLDSMVGDSDIDETSCEIEVVEKTPLRGVVEDEE